MKDKIKNIAEKLEHQIRVSHQQTPYCPHEILSAPLRGIKSIAYDIHDN